MVIGLLIIAGIPTTIGVSQALSAQKKANEAAKETAKFNMTVTLALDERGPQECFCVLKDGKIWIDHPVSPVPAHRFMGYYFKYPSEAQHLGMVSTIQDDPPMLHWCFVDKDTFQLSHGGRAATLGNITGPWSWSADEQWLTLEGDTDQFVAVEAEDGRWGVVWDRDRTIRDRELNASPEKDLDQDSEGDGEPAGQVEQTMSDGQKSSTNRSRWGKWLPIRLRRRMEFGMESRFVKAND